MFDISVPDMALVTRHGIGRRFIVLTTEDSKDMAKV